MGIEAILVMSVLGVAVVLFATEKLPVDVIALMVLAALALLGLLSPEQAISGFSSEATITVAAMFVLSGGLMQTGALDAIGRLFSRIRSGWLFLLAVMAVIGVVSAFVNNTAAVAVFLPLILAATARNKLSPSKVLIPLSYAAQMGGVCTLIGSSTNLLVHSMARNAGAEGFSLFEFTALGVVCMAAGMLYLLTVGRWLLPEQRTGELIEAYELGKYITELRVTEGSPLIGTSVGEAKLGEKLGVYVLELLRGEEKVWSPRAQKIEAGDVLLVRGDWSRLSALKDDMKLAVDPEFRLSDAQFHHGDRVLAEMMVAPNSQFDGRTLAELDFNWHYNATVLAVHRRGTVLREKLRDVRLHVGDILLLVTSKEEMVHFRRNANVLVLSEREDRSTVQRKAPVALAIMAAVIVAAGVGLVPIVIGALVGSVAMVLTRCLTPEDAYRSVDWQVILLLAGILPIGIALSESGAAAFLADNTLGRVADYGPWVVLATLYLLSLVLSEFMSNAAAAVLLTPIALSTANSLGIDPKPLLVAVTFAASTSFSTPVGYQTNTMVYSVGGYRFADFLKVGIPLNLIFWMIGVLLIPVIWPFSS